MVNRPPTSTKSTTAEPCSSPRLALTLPPSSAPRLRNGMDLLSDLAHGLVEESLKSRAGQRQQASDEEGGHQRDHDPTGYIAAFGMIVVGDQTFVRRGSQRWSGRRECPPLAQQESRSGQASASGLLHFSPFHFSPFRCAGIRCDPCSFLFWQGGCPCDGCRKACRSPPSEAKFQRGQARIDGEDYGEGQDAENQRNHHGDFLAARRFHQLPFG